MMSRTCLSVCFALIYGSISLAVPYNQQDELRLFAPASYDVETTVLLNDVTRKDKEVGYKITASLDMVPFWSHEHTEFLLSFQLRNPKLHLRGKYVHADFLPHGSIWDKHTDSTFFAHWKDGLIQTIYLDPSDIVDIINYKKSLASLFQFQVLDGEYNETDVSGSCMVLYETVSVNVFRKIKRSCIEDTGTVIEAKRVSRYTLTPQLDAVEAVYADEIIILGDAALGIKARAWTKLNRSLEKPSVPTRAISLEIALETLPEALKPLQLTLDSTPTLATDDLDDKELIKLLETIGKSDEVDGSPGGSEGAEAVIRLLPAIRLATTPRIVALLEQPELDPYLSVLCRVLGLAGTRAAYTAVSDVTHMAGNDPVLSLAIEYLVAFALSLEPEDALILDILRLGEEARTTAIAESALLSASAAASRHLSGGSALAQTVRDTLAKSVARCKEDDCRKLRIQALGNLRREDTADLLLQYALKGTNGSSDVPIAAIEALTLVPVQALTFKRLDKLTELALDERAPLELRALTLDLVVQRRTIVPAALARVARLLYERGPHELRRVFWQRLTSLAEEHEEMNRLPSMLMPVLRGWDAQAHSGTSSVLVRETGWQGAGWRGILESVQLANKGMLQRGATTLRAVNAVGGSLDALTVRIWTRGLEAFGGDSPQGEEEAPAVEAAGGLALSVGGARMRDIQLFKGQGELLGHIWAATASTPTPVLRSTLPLISTQNSIPLHSGVRITSKHIAAIQLALDASAHVSIWYRTARGELALRTAAITFYSTILNTSWGYVTVNVTATSSPQLRISVDTDFYSDVSVCVRSRTDEHVRTRRVTLQSEQGVRKHFVRRNREEIIKISGRTLSLGRINDETCRVLRSGDDDNN